MKKVFSPCNAPVKAMIPVEGSVEAEETYAVQASTHGVQGMSRPVSPKEGTSNQPGMI